MVIISAMAKVMFSSLSIACLSVCLSASNMTENGWTDFHEIFRVGGTLYKEQFGNIFRMFHLTIWIQDFVPHFFRAIHAS